jgi:hypothetical protein
VVFLKIGWSPESGEDAARDSAAIGGFKTTNNAGIQGAKPLNVLRPDQGSCTANAVTRPAATASVVANASISTKARLPVTAP